MRTSKVILQVIVFLMTIVISLQAQFRNVRIPYYAHNQVQPSIAVSPTYEWLLAAAWNDLPGTPVDPIYNVGIAISEDRGLAWVDWGLLLANAAVPSIAFDNSTSAQYQTSLHCVYTAVANEAYTGIFHRLTEDFANWRDPVPVSVSASGQQDAKIAIDNSDPEEIRVYVAWWEWIGEPYNTCELPPP
jgi:hypothetical protein